MIDRVGQRLGNYRLLRLLGRGSFSEVYLGEHLHLGTQAAIKVLHVHFTSEDSEQFRTEVRLVARLAHPLILRILDFVVEDGIPFLIMEYAPGGTLRQRHPIGTLVPLDTVVSYVNQLAEALHFIHEQGWVHRDMKPENLLLGRNHEVLLTDLGLSIPPWRSDSQQTKEIIGTMAYMAPEQIRGHPGPASDQYALGSVVYEWLSGDTPFHGTFEEIASQHLSAPPPSLRAKMPTISPGVEQVVLKALAKDPQQRFANVKDFALALEEAFKAESPGRMLLPMASSEHSAESGQKGFSLGTLPTGTVTMLFTDIEGSTRLLEQVGDRYTDVLAQCRQLLRSAFQAWNGYEVDTQGDSFFVAFARATDAVLAAVEAQRALAAHPWPEGVAVRVRVGLHTGEPAYTSEGYVGQDVHRAARIMSAAHGGQVLLSQTTANLVEQDLPEDLNLRDLGEHRLKDLGRPRRLSQLVISDLPADFPPLRTLDTYPNNLPTQHTPFIGREQELTAVRHLLSREGVRLVTLTGPGGTGKTRLGVQVAAELTDAFADGVFFVNLAPVTDTALVVPTIAETLGMRETGGRPLRERLAEELQQKQLLLLLDNFEQVVSAAVQVVDLVSTCPRLKVLVTSREALHVRAEQEFTVPPFPLPDLKHLPDLAALSHNVAVAFFVSRAQAVKPDFQVTNTNARAIVEICARLDGLPLAIELAAARMKLFSPQALLARLTPRLAVLTSGARDAPARQQTLRSTIAWSYHLLYPAEQQLFRRLSVFAGGCTLEAVEAVCQDMTASVLDVVASLIDKSLLYQVEHEGGEPRFAILETIREYGLECLGTSGEKEAIQGAHALYYLALTEEAESHLKGAQQTAWLERLEWEYGNLRLALNWLLEGKEDRESIEIALRLCVALVGFWIVRGHASEGRNFLEEALRKSEEVSVSVRAKALSAAADLALNQYDHDRAEVYCRESLLLYRELGNKPGIATSLGMLGRVTRRRGNYAAARTALEEGLVLFREVGDKGGIADLLTLLAAVVYFQGDYTRAYALAEESLALFRELGDKGSIAFALLNLAGMASYQGEYAGTYSLAEESLALFRELGDKNGIASASYALGLIALNQENYSAARPLLEESLAISKELGIQDGNTSSALARAAFGQGDYDTARTLYEESLKFFLDSGSKLPISLGLEELGAVVAAQGHVVWAARLMGAGSALREVIGSPPEPGDRANYKRMVAATKAQLGEQAFAAAWAEGRAMTPEQALAAQGPGIMPMPVHTDQPSPSPAKPVTTYPNDLTAREVEVLRLLAQGLTDVQIADQMVISPRTVNTHLTSIYGKIQVSSRSAATRYAIEHQLA